VAQAVRVILLGDAARRDGGGDLVKKLDGGLFPKRTLDAMLAYIANGTRSDELEELAREFRAALDVARSRTPGLGSKEKSDALARAKAGDVMRGPVTVAIQSWPQ
jgi:hypothetical protein